MTGLVPQPPPARQLERARTRSDPTGQRTSLLSQLAEVAVRTSGDGFWQEHASFLLGTSDGRWHIVDFSEPAACELVPKLLTLPAFDSEALLTLIGTRTEQVVVLWPAVSDAYQAERRPLGRTIWTERREGAGPRTTVSPAAREDIKSIRNLEIDEHVAPVE